MFHYAGTCTNTKGDSLVGWFVEVVQVDTTTVVQIYSDENLTPIIAVSGVANRAQTDSAGNYDFFVAEGTYSLRFYDAAGVYKDTLRYVNMYGGTGFISNTSLDVDPALTADSDDRVASQKAIRAYVDAGTAALAATGGAALVGSNDGSGGTLWTTLAGFVSKLLSSAGSSVIGFLQSGTGAVARTVQDKARESVSVLDFMSPAQRADVLAGTAAVDVSGAFNLAAAAANVVRVPGYTYLVNSQVDILDGQTWVFEGATLTHTDDTKTILRVNAKSDWAILGSVTLLGTLVTAATTAETGLYITSGKRYRVEGVKARKFKGKGIWLDGATAGTHRGDRGQFSDCGAFESTVGVQIDAGAGAEYNAWSNLNISGCVTGMQQAAGNNTIVGGSIVDNTTGVKLTAGSNHCHGAFVGTQINHNNSANLEAVGVLNGHTFVGCHFYGNGTSTGPIWLNGCKGITIQGGIVDCWIYNDSGTGSGANYIVDNFFPGDYGVTLNSNNSALGQLYLAGNYTSAGLSDLNDPAPVYVEATREGSTQSVTAGATVLDFNNKIKDKRGNYAAGVFTAPVAGTYEFDVDVTVSATSGLVNSYLAVVYNNVTDYAYIPVVALSGTLGIGSGVVKATLNAGDTIRIKSTITGTSPVLAMTQSRISITQISR